MIEDKKIWTPPAIYDLDLFDTDGGGTGGDQDGAAENYRDPITSAI